MSAVSEESRKPPSRSRSRKSADERDSIYAEYVQRKGEIINGIAGRYEGGSLIVTFNRAEGIMPRTEQITGETHHPGERIRCLILDVRDAANQVRIILSRTHPDFIRRLFELEVPEVAEGIIEIKALAREAGYRTKIAVHSLDDKVDAVGACVGVRGSRIRNIVDELGGEKIDIVRERLTGPHCHRALKPAEVSEIAICFELGRATVVVDEDQLSLAIWKAWAERPAGGTLDRLGYRYSDSRPNTTARWSDWRPVSGYRGHQRHVR